ncbi:MAG: alanyl-tRNA editing protein [Oscillospiraceae bacterium]|nr:alanyl-tRNA editing protein [Oscillospiraceae bacterium]
MTERLYDRDSHRREFRAAVLSCAPESGRWAVILDRSAFFPAGGGQAGDTGTLGGGRVLDTEERDGEVIHLCSDPLTPGETVTGTLDWSLRFARMQIHSGEHLVSGTAHRLWGCENVGFHMTERSATLDFDRELTADQLRELERRVNESVWADLPIRVFYPSPEELEKLVFRQKKALTGPVRLVEIPGVDLCACCAPHVEHTGEIGLVRLLDAQRHRGGIRITMTAGRGAWENAFAMGESADALSRLFSAPKDALPAAAERVLSELENARQATAAMERRYTALLAESAHDTAGDLCFFLPGEMSAAAARELAEAGKKKCGGICAVFAGDDETGWRYVMASESVDLRAKAKELNAALSGRGGGSSAMIQGGASAPRAEIERVFYGEDRR